MKGRVDIDKIKEKRKDWDKGELKVSELRNQYPKIFNSWRAMLYTEKGKKAGLDTETWRDFSSFLSDVLPSYKSDCVFRRKDKTKPWSVDNFMWITTRDYTYYQENVSKITYNGETLTARDWAAKCGTTLYAIQNRYKKYKKGLITLDEVFETKLRRRGTKAMKDYADSASKIRIKASKMLAAYRHKDKIMGFDRSDIDTNWFIKNILSQPCIYCGDTKRVGADRIDNSKGHTKDNIVPCCIECNTARNNFFSHEEMFKIGKAIAEVKAERGLDLHREIDMASALREETRSEVSKRVWKSKGREILQYDENGNIINRTALIVDMAEKTGYSAKSISAACHGSNNHYYRKYYWYLTINGERQ